MNILIIGNGFDIAHQLPTRYKDFLNLCLIATKVRVTWINEHASVSFISIDEYKEKDAEYFKIIKEVVSFLRCDLWEEFEKIVESNFWTYYFLERKDVIGEKWIDFEDEIKSLLESIYDDKRKSNDGTIKQFTNRDISKYYKKYNLKNKIITYRDLFRWLMDNLKDLTRALEIYIDGYINKKETDTLPYISKKQIDKVLSFNYTDTYSERYRAEIECCYLHGKADTRREKQECNLVLGFDNHYLDNQKVAPEIIPFEKYCQRIVNRTDSQYLRWLEEMNDSDDNSVVIFGHSLGNTDGDVLRKFILHKNTRTTIVFCDEEDRAEKIKNLAVIIGPDKLIELTGGDNPLITFEYH